MLAQKPIPRVLSRHNLILGGEREPVLVSALLCGCIGIPTMNFVGIITGSVLWIAALQAWRWMAKADPQMSSVYRRSLKYRGHYPAFSRPYRETGVETTTGHYLAAALLFLVGVYVFERLL
jgi:type IV secretory pathway TrbD component